MAEEMKVETPPEVEKGTATAPAPAEAEIRPPRELGGPGARPRLRWILGGVALVLLVAGTWLAYDLITYESTDDAQIDGHINPISSRISGYVVKVDVDDNQYVQPGQVLVEIDPADYQVAVDRARAELADAEATARALGINVPITSVNTSSTLSSAEADVANARAGVAAAEHQYAAAQAQLKEAEANNAKAQNDLARYKELVGKDEISKQQFDQAFAAAEAGAASVEAAAANVAAARQQLTQARGRLVQADASLRIAGTGPQQVATTRARALAADATVQQKQAALVQAQLNLQYCAILAPVAGVVNKNVEVGMYVQAGQQLLSIVPLEDVWVTANFKETQLKHMRSGQPAQIEVDANGRKYQGHVDSIAGASGARFSLLPPENATGNYVKVVQRVPVKIVLDPGQNRDHMLRPGMSVVPTVRVR